MNNLVHIGLPKSASTWLQQSAFPLLEPKAFHGPSSPLGSLLLTLLYENEYEPGALASAMERQRSHAGRRLVLSLEGLSFRGQVLPGRPRASIEETAARLGAEVSKPDVLFIVRRQDRLVRSVYAQYVHQGGLLTFEEWRKQPSRAYSFEAERYDHARTIEIYSRHAASMTVVPFELLATKPDVFLAQISAALGQGGPTTSVDTGRAVNPSLSPGGLRALQVWNRYLRKSPANPRPLLPLPWPERHRKVVQVAVDPLARRFTPKDAQDHDEWAAAFASEFAASNRELQAVVDADLESLGYPI